MTRLAKYSDKDLNKLAYAIEDMLMFKIQNKWGLNKEQLKEMEKEVKEERKSRNLEMINY